MPITQTPFFGREKDIQRIVDDLHDKNCRLITLVGPGGIGKTKLAHEIINRTQTIFENCYLLALQAVTSEQSLITELANALKIQIFDSLSPLDQIINWLSDRKILIVFDNFEHLVDAKHLITRIVSQTQHVQFLVTSRQPLKLHFEYIHSLDGLDSNGNEASPAVAMFTAYANQAIPTFEINRELSDVVQICQAVDGMPLAIQLASAWVSVISCKTIADEIQKSYQVLQTEQVDLPHRHRSIQACLDCSWALLSSNEQAVFSRLSVFSGGWDLQAVQQIAEADIWVLRSLIEKSFIQYDNIQERYHIHELMRQFGYTKLEQNAQDFEMTQRKYMTYFAECAFIHTDGFKGNHPESNHYFSTEKNNIIKVWRLAIAHQDIDNLERLWEGLFLFFIQSSNYREAEEIFHALLDAPRALGNSITLIGIALSGWFRLRTGAIEQGVLEIQRGLSIIEDIAHPKTKAESFYLIHYTSALIVAGQFDDVSSLIEPSIVAAQALQDPYYIGFTTYNYGRLKNRLGQYKVAETYLHRSIDISNKVNLFWGTALSLIELSSVYEATGQYDKALEALETSYSHLKTIDDYWGMVFALSYSSRILLLKDDVARAFGYLQRAFGIALESENVSAILGVVADSSFYLKHLNRLAQAVSLATYVLNHKATYAIEVERVQNLLKQLQSLIDAKSYMDASERGDNLTYNQVIEQVREIFTIPPTPDGRHPHDTLTPREYQILTMIGTTLTTEEIAIALSITKGTLRIHLKHIYSKLNVHSRIEAIAKATEYDLL